MKYIPTTVGRRFVAIICAILLLGLLACKERETLDVLATLELDRIPVIAQVTAASSGHEQNSYLLVMIDATKYHVRNTRSIAQVVAIYQTRTRRWVPAAAGSPSVLYATDYLLAGVIGMSLDHIVLPDGLSDKHKLPGAVGDPIWVKAGRRGEFINIEVAFNVDPLTIRKVSYNPAKDGLSLSLESGATLHVRPIR